MEVLVVCAHPHEASFNHAVTEAAVRGLERAGHHVTTLDLYTLGFDPAMSTAEFQAYATEAPLMAPAMWPAKPRDTRGSKTTVTFFCVSTWRGLTRAAARSPA